MKSFLMEVRDLFMLDIQWDAADDLATQEAWVSAAMILSYFSQNILTSAQEAQS